MKKSLLYILLLASGLLTSCYPGDEEFGFLMDVQTMEITPDALEAKLAGSYTVIEGEPTVTEVGFCWKISTGSYGSSPTKDDNVIRMESVEKNFSTMLTGLESNTSYKVCSYVRVGETYVYGAEESFYTPYAGSYLPTVKGVTVLSVHNNWAKLSAPVTVPDPAYPVLEAGIEYSVDNKSFNDYYTDVPKPTEVKGIWADGVVVADLTGLETKKTYYVRAYADNKVGRRYGTVSNFATLNAAPEISVPAVDNLLLTSAALSATLVPYDGNPVIEAGFQYALATSNLSIYSTSLKGVMNGNAVTLSLAALAKATDYQARTYAKTTSGTFYGPISNFKTLGDEVLPTAICHDFTEPTTTSFKISASLSARDERFPIKEAGFLYVTPYYASLDMNTNGAKRMICSVNNGMIQGQLTGLTPLTSYGVRAYVLTTNNLVIYSDKIYKVRTDPSVCFPVLGNIVLGTKTSNRQSVSCTIESASGFPVTECGFVYSSSVNPTVESGIKVPVSVSNALSTVLVLPKPPTNYLNYFVRAYAKNAQGIAYSNNSQAVRVNWND